MVYTVEKGRRIKGCMRKEIPPTPQEALSNQQKKIFTLYQQGLSNKEIALKLNLNPKTVASQLSRIRRKGANLTYTYKIEPGAEHVLNSTQKDSPSSELKKKIRNDPGFFSLMYNRYTTNKEASSETKYQTAAAGNDPVLLLNNRSKSIKILTRSGKILNHEKAVMKMDKNAWWLLRSYLQTQKIRPVQTFWDDGSAVYLVSPREVKIMKQLLDLSKNN